MKIIIVCNYLKSLLQFRGDLIKELLDLGHSVAVCSPAETPVVIEQLTQLNVQHFSINLDRTGINPLRDVYSIYELIRIYRKVLPDIVLNYTIKPSIYSSIAAKLAGVKRICSVITGLGYVYTGTTLKHIVLRYLVSVLYRIALSFNSCVFFLNQDDNKLFLDLNIISHDKSIILDGEGVDLDYYNQVNNQYENIGFIVIARLLEDKGIREYAEAACKLKLKYPHVDFNLLGPLDTNPSAIRRSELHTWEVQGSIKYLDETSDVRKFINLSPVLVLPSYREGMPRVILEAMAMGRPIVTTDVPGCRETVIHGENGFIVPVKEAEALASAMEKFILHPELIKQMGQRSREIAEEKYDVRKVNAVIRHHIGLLNEKIL